MAVEAPDFWNVPEFIQKSLYALATITMVVFFVGLWLRAKIWSLGIDTDNSLKGVGPIGLLIMSVTKLFSSDCIFATRMFRWSFLRGLLLVGIMWGFFLLFLGTVGRAVHYYGIEFLHGNTWNLFSLTLDLAGFFLLIGVLYALYRRYISPPPRLITSIQDTTFLFWLFLVILTGFFMEGSRIIAMQLPGMDWSPVGYVFGKAAFVVIGSDLELMKSVHLTSWIVHMLISLAFIAWIPYSKAFHMMAAQITTSLAAERKERAATQKVHWLSEAE